MKMANRPNRSTPNSKATDLKFSDPSFSDSIVSDTNASQWKAFRIIGGLIQLLAIGLCFELLLGITDGLGLILRLSFLAIVICCVAFRIGSLALVALQTSLFFQEPTSQPLEQSASGIVFVLVAMLAIVAATNMPQTHRFVTDFFLKLYGLSFDKAGSTKPRLLFAMAGLAIHMLHMIFVVILAAFLLTKSPIGRQPDTWLQWSLQNGQAVWPGALLLVFMIALLVLARENAWRQLVPAQASLYLRSVQLIANYRDLFGFERQRQKLLHRKQAAAPQPTLGVSPRPKIRKNSQTNRIGTKGLK